jgi:tetratricopeptide (TPR) repeat protein
MATQIQVSDAKQVQAAATDAIALFERIGDRKLLMSFYAHLAFEQGRCHDFAAAERSLDLAFALADEDQLRGSRRYADLVEIRGGVRARKGDTAEAKADLAEAFRLREADPENYRLYYYRAQIEFCDGHLTECVVLLEEGLGMRGKYGWAGKILLIPLVAAYLAVGEVDAAAKTGAELLEFARFAPQATWSAIWHVAAVIALRGHPAEAVRLAGFAAAISDVPDPGADRMRRSSHDILMSSARQHFSAETIATLTAEGARLDLDAAIDEAVRLCS